jgi:hypothetical protein
MAKWLEKNEKGFKISGRTESLDVVKTRGKSVKGTVRPD